MGMGFDQAGHERKPPPLDYAVGRLFGQLIAVLSNPHDAITLDHDGARTERRSGSIENANVTDQGPHRDSPTSAPRLLGEIKAIISIE
jgi:hypothetical protein